MKAFFILFFFYSLHFNDFQHNYVDIEIQINYIKYCY
jgi:hypothetical protein